MQSYEVIPLQNTYIVDDNLHTVQSYEVIPLQNTYIVDDNLYTVQSYEVIPLQNTYIVDDLHTQRRPTRLSHYKIPISG